MATPKLALIPTGYKAGKLYSVLPESGVGDFTVVRATEATRVNEAGLIETMGANVPRLDYSGGGCPVLLIEPQSTNLSTRSNELNLWGAKVGVAITANYSLSPNGSINSNRLLFSANGYCHNNNVQTIGTTYTISAYAKRNSGTENVGFFTNGSGAVNYSFNLTNEWQRFEYTYTSTNTSTFGFAGVSGADISVYGFQLEVGSYATSYIKTEGSAVTRNGDQVYGAGYAATFNDSEGVLMAEISALANDLTYRQISLTEAGGGGDVLTLDLSSVSNGVRTYLKVNGTPSILNATLSNETDFNKIAVKYGNTHELWINGFEVSSQSLTLLPITLNRLNFDNGVGGGNFYGNTSQVQYFNTALTDSELEKLTSWASFIEMAQAQNYNII